MNILIIGNGFDLAHGLPTRYMDFLKFCSKIIDIFDEEKSKELYREDWLNDWETSTEIKDMLRTIFKTKAKMKIKIRKNKYIYEINFPKKYIWVKEIYKHIINNFWIEYFMGNEQYQRENWIDFESEIHKVIASLDSDMALGKKRYKIEDGVEILSNSFLKEKFLVNWKKDLYIEKNSNWGNETVTFAHIREQLQKDLERITRALELYLAEVVKKISIKECIPEIQTIKVDHVLSFNYTNTYEMIYDKDNSIIYDYIHGRAVSGNTLETNNMVMGIDEYLSSDRKDVDVDFICFKKFYQRIHKETGCIYKEWSDAIMESAKGIESEIEKQYPRQVPYYKYDDERQHRLYIFGHSLDATDGDILRDLILHDNVYTTIFYRDKKQHGQQIANLVRVIGQEELIRRTGGITKTIEFKLQEAT